MPVKPDTAESDGDCLFEPLDTHYSHLAEATVLVDLRKHPRFDTRFPAEAISENGRKALATITNISRSGLRLEGNRRMLDTLLPNSRHQTRHTPTRLQIKFTVPGGTDHHLPVKAQCLSVYIRHEKKDSWQIGITFTGFDQGNKALTEYLLLRESTS